MKLQKILAAAAKKDFIKKSPIWEKNPEIKSICYNSKKASAASIFFAIKGYITDGKKYIGEAFDKGSHLAIVDSLDGVDKKFWEKCLVVKNPRLELANASSIFYNHPSKDILLIGITGTNGKTSCVHIMRSILEELGKKVAIMSTIECSYPTYYEASTHTTKESLEIQAFLRNAVENDVNAAIIEVSAHALSLYRVKGCEFNAVLFNNIEIDHQDFYKNIENYYKAKRKLFLDYKSAYKNTFAIVNLDDAYSKRLLSESKIPSYSFGIKNKKADIYMEKLEIKQKETNGSIRIKDDIHIHFSSSLTTKFNAYNIIACVALSYFLNIAHKKIESALNNIKKIPGRLESIDSSLGFRIYIDFAHSGTALYNLLYALRALSPSRLILVFGAGGDKDPLRRKIMAEAAAELADIIIITSDNPRWEEPLKIIQEIEKFFKKYSKKKDLKKEKYILPDRAKAIRKAIHMAKKGDFVCIAGKGHEQSQIIKDKIFEFDDILFAKSILKEIK